MMFEIADTEALATAYCQPCQMQPCLVVEQFADGLQRVVGRHQIPQFIDELMAHKPAAKGEMSLVDRIEAAAVDADGHYLVEGVRGPGGASEFRQGCSELSERNPC